MVSGTGIIRVALGLLALVYCFAANATNVLLLDKSQPSYPLGEQVEYLEDQSGRLEIKELTQQPESVWRKHSGKILNFGFSQSAYWFRIELQANEPLRWLLDIDYPLLDEISLYTFAGGRALQTVQTGDSRPYVYRPLKHVAFDIPLELPAVEPVTVYLRVKSIGTVQVPLMLWQEDAYFEHYQTITAIQGIYFGIVLIMIFYNLLLYLTAREPGHLHYVLFVAMIGLFTAGLYGWGYKYLWPEAVQFQQYNIAVFIALSVIFACRFILHFLDLSHTAPGIGQVLRGVVLSQLAVLALLPALGFHLGIQIVLALTVVTAVTTLYAGILLWRQGQHAARYFTSAWGLFLFSVLLATLEKFGLIPSMFWTAVFLPLGMVSIVSLLSLALADRLNFEKQQRVRAQQQLLRLQEKNREELEQQVNERTIALEQELVDHRKAELALHDSEENIRKLNENLEVKVRERTQQLIDAQEELVRKEKLALLGQIADTVGHELRNPLGVMNNAVYFLQTVLVDTDATTKEYLGIIKDEIADAERIVSDLLDAVRSKPPHPEEVKVAELIEQTLRKCAVPAAIKVGMDIPPTLPLVRVDQMHLHQIVWNLISNAMEAMPEGGMLEITADADLAEKTVRLGVRDSGCGMTEEQQARLFQPLFTTKPRRIGLGLVVVKNLTQLNGGSVSVQSAPGKGSVFTVTLPCGK